MSAHCNTCGDDLDYELNCGRCTMRHQRDDALAALQRMYDHVHEGCDTEFSNPCNIELGKMHNPCWCRQARTALSAASSRTEHGA